MKAKFLTIQTQWANSIAPWHDSHSEQRRASLDPLLAPIATAFGPSESRALSRFARLRVGADRGPRAAGGLPPLLGHPVVVLRAHLVIRWQSTGLSHPVADPRAVASRRLGDGSAEHDKASRFRGGRTKSAVSREGHRRRMEHHPLSPNTLGNGFQDKADMQI